MGKPIPECTAKRIRDALDENAIALLKKIIEDIEKNKDTCDVTEEIKRYRSYIESYKPIAEVFECLIEQDDDKKWLIGGASLVYSWMPTALILHICHKDKAICSLKEIKKRLQNLEQEPLDKICSQISNEIALLRNCINNSISGTSKFLHFSFPEVFPIWDSRVARALKYTVAIFKAGENDNDIRQYLAYVKAVNEVCNDKTLLKKLDKIPLLKKMEPIRKIEHALFLIGGKKKKKKKKKTN